ncbi:MAG TPA: hypothetical protein VE646_06830 [Actinomycetota bacterium]|nr:hypothetical protein [Actinomycetota bacterium]
MALTWMMIGVLTLAGIALIGYVVWRAWAPDPLGSWRRDEYDWTVIRFDGAGRTRVQTVRTPSRRPGLR